MIHNCKITIDEKMNRIVLDFDSRISFIDFIRDNLGD